MILQTTTILHSQKSYQSYLQRLTLQQRAFNKDKCLRFGLRQPTTSIMKGRKKLTDDKLERAGQIFPLSRALPQRTGTPASTAGGPVFCRVVLTWPFWYTLHGTSCPIRPNLGRRQQGLMSLPGTKIPVPIPSKIYSLYLHKLSKKIKIKLKSARSASSLATGAT